MILHAVCVCGNDRKKKTYGKGLEQLKKKKSVFFPIILIESQNNGKIKNSEKKNPRKKVSCNYDTKRSELQDKKLKKF